MTVAVDSRTGRTIYRGEDPGAAIQAAIDNATVAGGTVTIAPGDYYYKQVVPTFRQGGTRWVTLRGEGATIILSSSAPRAFDVLSEIDHVTFRKIWIEGVSIDAAGLGGNHHTVFGNRIEGVRRRSVSFEKIVLRRIHARGILTSGEAERDSRFGVALDLWSPRSRAPEASFARDIVIDAVRLEGGNSGFMITADAPDEERAPNAYIDNVWIEHCSHTLGAFPRNFFASSNIHVGNLAKVGIVVIRDNEAQFAGDNGIEVNNADLALILNNSLRDQWNVGYYATNYNRDFDSAGQTLLFSGNTSKITQGSTQGGYARGFIFHAFVPSLGAVIMASNEYDLDPDDNSHAHALAAWGPIANMEVSSFRARFRRVRNAGATPTWHAPLVFEIESDGVRSNLVLRDLELDYTVELDAAAAASGASISPYLLFVGGEDLYFDAADVHLRASTSNFGADTRSRVEFVTVGRWSREAIPFTTVQGRLTRFLAEMSGDDDDPVGVLVGSTVSSMTRLVFDDFILNTERGQGSVIGIEVAPEATPQLQCADGSPLGTACIIISD